jgi:phosphoribosylglycinamide formyltransferase-1/phosphoribosylamine--glycine ligase/phosphoribosylglycinamide formyltransferase/phosphoribosylformylglycinamidine cyclo-ligase
MPAPRAPATREATASAATLDERRRRLAAICEGYPETVAVARWDNPHLSLEVAGKRFGYYLERHFGDDGRSGAVLKALPGVQEMLVEDDPDTFWVPAFVGRHGWIGIRLDLEEPDWDAVEDFVRDAWLLAAPKRLRQQLAERL